MHIEKTELQIIRHRKTSAGLPLGMCDVIQLVSETIKDYPDAMPSDYAFNPIRYAIYLAKHVRSTG